MLKINLEHPHKILECNVKTDNIEPKKLWEKEWKSLTQKLEWLGKNLINSNEK